MRLLIPLFSPAVPTWGGLTRAVAVAEAAVAAGHEVAICASGALADTAAGRGYRVYRMPEATMLGLPRPLSRVLVQRSQRAAMRVRPGRSVSSIWLALTMFGMAGAGYLRRAVDAQEQAARDFRADALFTDLDPAAFVLSASTGIPITLTYASVLTHGRGSWPWKLMRRGLTQVLRDRGAPPLTPDELFFGPKVMKVIPSVPELDGTDPSRPDVAYVGQLLGPIRRQSLAEAGLDPAGRYVFVYLGTPSLSLEAVRRVLPEVFPAGSGITCVVGEQSVKAVHRIGNVEFRPYVAAEALLPHCDWTLCHGGQNTIIQSLLYGVPLLVFPGPLFERRFNARMVAQAGAGVMGESNEFTAAWLTAAMARRGALVGPAAHLSEQIRSYGGAEAAVEAINSRLVS